MHKITMYETKDGEIFYTQEEAEKHEAKIIKQDFVNKVYNTLGLSQLPSSSYMLCKIMLEHASELIPILQDYMKTSEPEYHP